MHVVLKERQPKGIEDMVVVREFLEVFGELPGLPPSREISFSIKMEPRVASVHKAPFRITLA